ncbi:MAG: gluconolactonase [Abitibacteriaceae bacterium]|nr:gluconolactonase [Abditibacteriaceae bacterium]MBV9867359.1 gluconolactonase [Abditibacteriaceae bacterium]
MKAFTQKTSYFMRTGFCTAAGASVLVTLAIPLGAKPSSGTVSRIESVAQFYGPMPTGVTVSHQGRIFVNYPRWGDPVKFTVGELRHGRAVPFPDMNWNRRDRPQADRLVAVQSVVVDPLDRLWILDTGSVKFGPTSFGGPKLVGVDLRTNRVIKKILFPPTVALKTTYLNDIRFDLRRGAAGMAFITDSSDKGPNGIIVVDLATGRSWRRLHDHPSTKAEPKFLPFVENQPLMKRPPKGQGKVDYIKMGSDGIAISNDGKRLFYCPLASRHLYSVSVDALADQKMSDAQVAATVVDHGIKGASDGLESDDKGRVYVTDYEHNAIRRRFPDGHYETVAQDSRMLWPDTMSVATNHYLYFTANQLHRQPSYHYGKDLRKKPYHLFRVKIDAGPVLLRPAR